MEHYSVREVERQELAFALVDELGHVAARYRNAEEAHLGAVAPELLAALERIANSEPRPNRRRLYSADDIADLQRIARTAAAKARVS